MRGFSLYQMQYASSKSQNLLALKWDLLNLKHAGALFFKPDISVIHPDERFEVYHYKSPGKMPYRNAFPVEKYEFINLKLNTNNYKTFLKEKYVEYYNEDVSDESIKQFQNSYLAEEYVWIYK
ncbi:hypothetical protein [Neobacillus mesonae]|uniref:hypothetical protein n=1 Tax=Neobacillus mesonae TaxID=1193713 RepID=UPI00082B1153|nr:hypothetical protein [Neobacillus mesonae]